jgi:alpha-tubulin suppressor-like RCC1 family protein
MILLSRSTSRRRVAWGALAFVLGGCNTLFGIEPGSTGAGAGGAGGSTGTPTTTGPTTTTASTMTTTGSGGTGGATTTTLSTGTGGAGGGPGCNTPGSATCSGATLEICDAGGHLTTQTCEAVAACDPIAGICTTFASLPRLSLAQAVGCAIEDDHSVRCWGDDYYQNLFVGDPNAGEPSAVAITGATDARQLSLAGDHGCFVVSSGAVVCWGESDTFALGIQGTAQNPSPPVTVWAMGAPLAGALEVAVLNGCSCARMVDGTVQCWGYQGNGCFGDASTASANQPYPTPIPGVARAVQIRSGVDSSILCVREIAGAGATVSCWAPGIALSQIPGVTDATDVAPGNGLVFIKSKSQGLLSAAPRADKTGWTNPSAYTSAGAITLMAAGDAFCGLQAGTAVVCGLLDVSNAPPLPLPLPGQPAGTVVELAAGESWLYGQDGYQCLRLSGPISGNVYCWGDDGGEALGDGAPEIYRTFAEASGLAGAVALSTAQSSSFAVRADGSIDFWGYSEGFGTGLTATPTSVASLGTGNTAIWSNDTSSAAYVLGPSTAPIYLSYAAPMANAGLAVSGFTDFVEARPWGLFDIGLRAGGTIVMYPWDAAANTQGIFGNGATSATVGTPVTVPTITTATAVASYLDDYATSPSHVCAILGPSGSVSCWGGNHAGELGIGGPTGNGVTVLAPSAVTLPTGESAVSIAAGAYFTCVAAASGKVYCWGDNETGQLGSTGSGSNAPVQVPGITNAVGVTARYDFACAWLSDQTAQCWGDNSVAQLGNGTLSLTSPPGPVTGLTNVVKVSAGSTHACALRSDGSVVCWGDSYFGQAGAGLTGLAAEPQAVKGL